MMNRDHPVRTLILIVLVGLFLAGLTSCKLPASQGPSSSSNQFPVPSEGTAPTSGIDVSAFATQTAQALPVFATLTPVSRATSPTSSAPLPTTTNPPTQATIPTATSVLSTPKPTTVIGYVQATPGAPPASYTLQSGEYPFCIARRFNVSIEELLSINGLTVDSVSYTGEVLKIPQTGNPFEGTRALIPHPDNYTVQSGDTLDSIACDYGDVSPDMIALQNNLTSTTLNPGQVLVIP